MDDFLKGTYGILIGLIENQNIKVRVSEKDEDESVDNKKEKEEV